VRQGSALTDEAEGESETDAERRVASRLGEGVGAAVSTVVAGLALVVGLAIDSITLFDRFNEADPPKAPEDGVEPPQVASVATSHAGHVGSMSTA
jgi:hypothetical protein